MNHWLTLSLGFALFAASCTEVNSSEETSENESTVAEELISSEPQIQGEPSTKDTTVQLDFALVHPDTVALKKVWEGNENFHSKGYLYLSEYYAIAGNKDSVEYYGDSEEYICQFYQEFEYGITYSKSNCSEEGGAEERITFPRLSNAEAHDFVNTLFNDPWNTWTTELTYEADGAGCYYSIIQKEQQTIISIWCGC